MSVIEMTLEVINDDINMSIDDGDTELGLDVGEVSEVVTSDYEKLQHIPTINGTLLVGNYDEIDPTVPEWAKTEKKPSYTADEINAVNNDAEITTASIDAIISAVFGIA